MDARLLVVFLLFPIGRLAAQAPPPKNAGDGNPPYSMPTEEIYTAAELKDSFEYRKAKPYDDESLAIELPCRKTWKWIELKSSTKVDYNRLVPLARVEAPDQPDVAIEMKYIALAREVALEDWVDWFMDEEKLFVVHGQRGTYHERRMLDTLVEFKADDGRLFVGRVAFFKNADRIYMISGTAPKEKYETYTSEFGLAATCATPATLVKRDFAEPMDEYIFTVGEKYAFTHPVSWKIADAGETPPGVDAVDLYQENPKTPVGLIKVRVYRKDQVPGINLDRVGWSVLEEIKSASPKFQLKDKLTEMPASTDLFPGNGVMRRYAATLAGSDVELWELVLDGKESLFAVYLVAPPRKMAPMVWMVDKRAWEIVGMRIRNGK